jgi:hypothetical protein
MRGFVKYYSTHIRYSGTDDIWTPAANSLMIAEKVPAAWLNQIRDSGHGLMYQYHNKFTKVVSTFLQVNS